MWARSPAVCSVHVCEGRDVVSGMTPVRAHPGHILSAFELRYKNERDYQVSTHLPVLCTFESLPLKVFLKASSPLLPSANASGKLASLP